MVEDYCSQHARNCTGGGLSLMTTAIVEKVTLQPNLSAAQMGIWLGQQVNPHSPMYNAAEYIELRGEFNSELFKQALRLVISEAVALHIIFEQTSSGPVQKFVAADWHLIHQDFSQASAPMAQAREWMLNDLATVTDIARGPLFAQALLKLGEQHYYWYQRIHHIASDGFSFALLTQKVAEQYTRLVNADTFHDSAAKNGLPFASAITAFNKVLTEDQHYQQSPAYLNDKEFWNNYLSNQCPPRSLSPLLAPIADLAIRMSTLINSQQVEQLKTIANRLAVNWADLLIAQVAQVVYQNTGAHETTFGIPVMGRMGSAALRVPAMVMNIIPLRINFSDASSLAQLTQHISQQIKKTRPHSRYRYEQLKRDLTKLSSEQRLFGTVVNIMPFDRPLEFANCSAQLHNLSAGPVEDISFSFVLNHDGSLRFDLDANPNRYSTNELQTIQNEFLAVLNTTAKNSSRPLTLNRDKLSWLEGAKYIQHQKDTSDFNHADSVLKDIYQHIKTTPHAIALQIEARKITYAELGRKVSQCVRSLYDAGIKNNTVIALALTRSENAIITALATLLTGNSFVFIDTKAPITRNQLILRDAQPALLIGTQDYISGNDEFLRENHIRHAFEDNINEQAIDEDWETRWKMANTIHGTAYFIYTSGSTGTPKGIIISHNALAEFVASADDAYGITPQDSVLQFAPLHFDACIEEIFVTLARGARLVLRNESMLESMPRFIAQCDAWHISVLDLPTAFWHELAFACVTTDIALPPTLRTIIIGGEAVLPERVAQWRERYGHQVALLNTYGPSEATVIATYANLTHHAISIGQPLNNRAVVVVDHDLRLLPKGESGELLLLGGGLGDGYLHLPQKTAASFIELNLPWFSLPQRAYRTGDRVNINRNNCIEFIGRLDDQLKISGYRIDPLEVEAALVGLDDVQEAAIVAITQANGTKCIVAHIVSNTAYDVTRLRTVLKDQLPAPMLPSAVVMHEALPKNSSGKIDRKQLLLRSDINPDSVPHTPASAQQKIIIDAWQDVLGHYDIQLEDDFFLLGGSSLQTIQLANRLAIQLQREVPLTLIFQHPTVAGLSTALFPDTHTAQVNDIQHSMREDCLAFELALPVNKKGNSASQDVKNILLTGATGFVGAQLLHQLFEQTTATIMCTVRAEDETLALLRIKKALEQQGLPCADVQRIQIVLADLEKPELGLTQSQCIALANKVDVVIHNAAVTSVMRDYHSLRAANALSTGELLKLAAVKAIPFHLISTIAVAPPASIATTLPEDFVSAHSGLQDGYQQSKWVAEQMVAIAQQKKYPVNVYRLARVTGSANSGYVNPKDLVWSIIQTGIRNGALPDLPITEPWTPVDAIARFIVADALANPGQGICNVTPARHVQLAQIYQWLMYAGFSFEILPVTDWCTKVKHNSLVNGSIEDQAILGFFTQRKTMAEKNHTQEMNAEHKNDFSMATISNKKCTTKMQALRLQLPDITPSLFERYLRYAIRAGLVHTPSLSISDASLLHVANVSEITV
jgi:nonribosomal peptide synthetase MxcG